MSNEPKAGMNLDPEMIAAYIDKRLSPEQRAVVEAELASDPDSYALFVETIKALDAMPATEAASFERSDASRPVPFVPRQTSARRWTLAAGLLAAAAAVVLVVRLQPGWLQGIRGGRVDPQIERLVAAVGDERYFAARLTGGFRYGPMRSVSRGPENAGTANLELRASVAQLERDYATNPSIDNQHALGSAQLLLGRDDEAITTLTNVTARPGAPARAVSDLAAAYLVRAVRTGSTDDARKALDLSETALRTDPAMVEAMHNSATAAQLLGDTSVATARWNQLLTVDPSPEWRAEAERHLAELPRRTP